MGEVRRLIEKAFDEILVSRGVGGGGGRFFLLDHLGANNIGLNKFNIKRLMRQTARGPGLGLFLQVQ